MLISAVLSALSASTSPFEAWFPLGLMVVWLAHNSVLETEMVVSMLLTFQIGLMDLSCRHRHGAKLSETRWNSKLTNRKLAFALKIHGLFIETVWQGTKHRETSKFISPCC